jgi:UDP-N-acetylglucosamine 2-epimerase (non-hydrolysing)
MKVLTLLGTRPEIIRTSRITPKLDALCEHTIVYTNQNSTYNMKDIFFEQLGLRQPDICFNSKGSLGEQLAEILPKIETTLKEIKPDKVFILGDTNSALCAIIVERMGIPVYHMESANRSYNRSIPEEVNRALLDRICSYNLFYTPLNRHTLLTEGCSPNKIFQCGNPTLEVMDYYRQRIDEADILDELQLTPKEYFLVDIHRTENVDYPERLSSIIEGLNLIGEKYNRPVICSLHPRTQSKLHTVEYNLHPNVKFLDSMGFFSFQKLEKNALVGLTDSGLCSEEYCLYQVPCVIVRNETERPEVVEVGGAIIAGVKAKNILRCTEQMVQLKDQVWTIPEGYGYYNVSERVVNYILGR